MNFEANVHPWEGGTRRKAYAHGGIVAATTPNIEAALSASHINNDVYVDNTRVYMMRS
jgi:hypothetical protein